MKKSRYLIARAALCSATVLAGQHLQLLNAEHIEYLIAYQLNLR